MEQQNLFDSPQVEEIADKTVCDNLHEAFDSVAGEQLKREGMSEAAKNRADLLSVARMIARNIAQFKGTCTADDVLNRLIRQGYNPADLGNAAGSIFRGAEWEFTGRWVPSERTTNHRRYIRVWRLKGDK